MSEYRVVALSQHTADEVRNSLRAPGYGHPAHVETATATGPCRPCLEPFRVGEEERVLFTYNPFPDHARVRRLRYSDVLSDVPFLTSTRSQRLP